MAKILTDRSFIKTLGKDNQVKEAINLTDSNIDFSKDPTTRVGNESIIQSVVRHLLASYYTDYPDHDIIVNKLTVINSLDIAYDHDMDTIRKLLVGYMVRQLSPETLLVFHFPETPEFMIDEKDALSIETGDLGLYCFSKDVWDISEFLGIDIEDKECGHYAFYAGNSAGNTMLHALLESRRKYFHTFENNGTYVSWMSNPINLKSESVYDTISYEVKQHIMDNIPDAKDRFYYIITKIHNDVEKSNFESDHDIITMFDNDLYFGAEEFICTRTYDDAALEKFLSIGFREIKDISRVKDNKAHFLVLDNGCEIADFLISKYSLSDDSMNIVKVEETRTDVITEQYANNASISYYRAYAKNGDKNDFLARDVLSFGDILKNKFDQVIIISYVNPGNGAPKELFDEFAKAHKDEIILLRIGYDCDEKESYINGEFCELIADAEDAGFKDINNLCNFEFSTPFLYRNERARELLRAIVRFEIRQHSENFVFEDVAKDLTEKKDS